ncbi:hypothetical protein TNCV_4878441 [Trichonephila clavipes]|nr:hypothetical protein TNCV_4878441 [Trichonephila clavipes]
MRSDARREKRQEKSRPKSSRINAGRYCPLQQDVTRVPQLFSDLMNFMQSQASKFQVLQFSQTATGLPARRSAICAPRSSAHQTASLTYTIWPKVSGHPLKMWFWRVTSSKVHRELVLAAGLSRELKNLGFYDRAAAHKPNITPKNAKYRLQWCRAHRHWTVNMGKTVV